MTGGDAGLKTFTAPVIDGTWKVTLDQPEKAGVAVGETVI